MESDETAEEPVVRNDATITAAEFREWVAQIPADGFVGYSPLGLLFYTDKDHVEQGLSFDLNNEEQDKEFLEGWWDTKPAGEVGGAETGKQQ